MSALTVRAAGLRLRASWPRGVPAGSSGGAAVPARIAEAASPREACALRTDSCWAAASDPARGIFLLTRGPGGLQCRYRHDAELRPGRPPARRPHAGEAGHRVPRTVSAMPPAGLSCDCSVRLPGPVLHSSCQVEHLTGAWPGAPLSVLSDPPGRRQLRPGKAAHEMTATTTPATEPGQRHTRHPQRRPVRRESPYRHLESGRAHPRHRPGRHPRQVHRPSRQDAGRRHLLDSPRRRRAARRTPDRAEDPRSPGPGPDRGRRRPQRRSGHRRHREQSRAARRVRCRPRRRGPALGHGRR